jgi:hypothetical protein
MSSITTSILVRRPDSDDEQVQELTQNLRDAVLDAPVDDARPVTAGLPPPGAKSGELVAVGALVVTLAPIVVEGLVTVLTSWLDRQSPEVEIDVNGIKFRGPVTRAKRDELVALILRTAGLGDAELRDAEHRS